MAVRLTMSAWFCQLVSANVLSGKLDEIRLAADRLQLPRCTSSVSASEIWSMGMRRMFRSHDGLEDDAMGRTEEVLGL